VDAGRILWIIGLVTAVLISTLGFVVILNIVVPTDLPTNFRTMLGAILMLYGIYQFIALWMKRKEQSEPE